MDNYKILRNKLMKQLKEIINKDKVLSVFKKNIKIFLIIGLVLLLSFIYFINSKYNMANPDTPYEIINVEKRDLFKSIIVNGEIVSENEVQLSSDASGRITNIYVNVGQKVKKGDILARIENSAEQAQLMQSLGALQAAEANVKSSKASLARIEGGTREEQLRILESVLQGNKDEQENAIQSAYNVLSNTYALTNQAVIHGTDSLFKNPLRYNPKIDFTVSNSELRDRLSAVRVDIRYILDRHEDVLVQDMSIQEIRNELGLLLDELKIINNFYADIFTAIEKAVISDEVESKYVSIVTPARSTVFGQMNIVTAMRNVLDQKENNIKIAQANLDQAITGAVKEDIDVVRVGVDSAEASLLSAKGNYQAAQASLKKTYMKSPFSGIVTDIYKETGEFVLSTTPLIKVSSENKYISALVSEVDIAKVNIGASVSLELDALPELVFAGKVDFIYPSKQEEVGIVYYEIRITSEELELSEFNILPGLSLDVTIDFAEKKNVLAIERSVVKKDDNGKYFVWVLNPNKKKPIDEKFAKVFFENGFVGDKYIEVLSELAKETGVVKFLQKENTKKK